MRPLTVLLTALWLLGSPPAWAAPTTVAIPPELPARIDALEPTGQWRTEAFVIAREMPWKPGETVTPEQWELGIRRLWNTLLFSRIDARLEDREGRRVAVIQVEERWTFLPSFRFNQGGGAREIRLGASDINLFGRYLEGGAAWQRFDAYNGGKLWFRNPRLFDERQMFYVQVERAGRTRPEYVTVSDSAKLEYARQHTDLFQWGGTLDAGSQRYEATEAGTLRPPADTDYLLVGPYFRPGRLDNLRIQVEGIWAHVQPRFGIVDTPGYGPFGQLDVDLQAFRIVSEWLNLALRVRLGLQTRVPDQMRYFVGGLDNLRGYADNSFTGNAALMGNFEARVTAFDSTWVAIMPVAFVDASGVVTAGGVPQGGASIGAGLRLISPRLLKFVGRVDVAYSPWAPTWRPVSFGVFQFF